jgi:hypothetical protein
MFLAYLSIGCFYVVLLALPALSPALELPFFTYNRDHARQVLFIGVLCLSVGFAVLCLAAFHLFLLLTNQTTLELYNNMKKTRKARKEHLTWVNPYDLGRKANIAAVLGTGKYWCCIFVPFGTTTMEGDDYIYKDKSDATAQLSSNFSITEAELHDMQALGNVNHATATNMGLARIGGHITV